MSIELCVLASGSSGNCSVVRTPVGMMLIDAGIGPRIAAQRLAGTGVRVADISAICLTHLDADHFSRGWAATLIRHQIIIFCHGDCVEALVKIADDENLRPLVRPFECEPFEPLPGLRVRPIALAHDDKQCHAFLLEGFGRRLGYATDLGHVPDPLVDHFIDLDVLAMESNYEPRMQIESARPLFLKQRIMGGRGHLSNQQALEGIRRILDRAQRGATPLPSHIVLLHRSRQCNCPKVMRTLFETDRRIAPRLILAEQYHRTEWISPPGRQPLIGEQLLLSWGG